MAHIQRTSYVHIALCSIPTFKYSKYRLGRKITFYTFFNRFILE